MFSVSNSFRILTSLEQANVCYQKLDYMHHIEFSMTKDCCPCSDRLLAVPIRNSMCIYLLSLQIKIQVKKRDKYSKS